MLSFYAAERGVLLCVLTFYYIFLLSNIKIGSNFYGVYALKSK